MNNCVFEIIAKLNDDINRKVERVQSLNLIATKTTTVLSDMPKSSTFNIRSLEDVITQIVDLEAEINVDIDKLADLKSKVVLAISKIENSSYRFILTSKYLEQKSWSYIVNKLGFSQSHVFRLHKEALKVFYNFYKNESKCDLNESKLLCYSNNRKI